MDSSRFSVPTLHPRLLLDFRLSRPRAIVQAPKIDPPTTYSPSGPRGKLSGMCRQGEFPCTKSDSQASQDYRIHRITVAWFASDLGMEGTQRSTSSVFVIGGSSQGVDIQIQSEPLYSELPLPACYKTTSKVKSTHPCRVVIPIVMLLSRKRSNSDISSENARPANHCEGTLICRRLTAFQKFHALICWGVQARLPLYPKGLWGHQSSSRDRVLF
jgi:hypothetical protein